jgi:hypothetical protein
MHISNAFNIIAILYSGSSLVGDEDIPFLFNISYVLPSNVLVLWSYGLLAPASGGFDCILFEFT